MGVVFVNNLIRFIFINYYSCKFNIYRKAFCLFHHWLGFSTHTNSFWRLFLYILFGRRILKDKKLVLKKNEDEALKQCLSKPKVDSNNLLHHDVEIRHSDMITMFDSLGASTFTSGNDDELYSESNEFFDSLLNALNNAKKSINIQFYIFKDDTIGSKIIEVLEEKQREGVRVKVLYDAMGSRKSI